jgi:hypothetical protein
MKGANGIIPPGSGAGAVVVLAMGIEMGIATGTATGMTAGAIVGPPHVGGGFDDKVHIC